MNRIAPLIIVCILTLQGCGPAAPPAVGAQAYCQETVQTLDAVKANMPQIERSAAQAASLYCDKWHDMGISADGSAVFTYEVTGRSGGVMAMGSGASGDKNYRGIVLYCLQGRDRFAADLERIAAYNEHGCHVFLFGPKDLLQRAQLVGAKVEGVIEIPNAAVAGVSTYDFASVCGAWPWVCEFVAACTRQGHMPVMYQSAAFPSGVERIQKNALRPSEKFKELVDRPEVQKALEEDSTLRSLRAASVRLQNDQQGVRRFPPRNSKEVNAKLEAYEQQIDRVTREVIDKTVSAIAACEGIASPRSYRKFEPATPRPIRAGQLGNEWLSVARQNLAALHQDDMAAISRAAEMAAASRKSGHAAYLHTNLHAAGQLASSAFNPPNFLDTARMPADKKIAKGDMLLGLAYNNIFTGEPKFVEMARASGAVCVWSASKPAAAGDPKGVAILPGEVFIDQHWALGDADVTVPGYDIKIGPTSGAVELAIYMMINAQMSGLMEAQMEPQD